MTGRKEEKMLPMCSNACSVRMKPELYHDKLISRVGSYTRTLLVQNLLLPERPQLLLTKRSCTNGASASLTL